MTAGRLLTAVTAATAVVLVLCSIGTPLLGVRAFIAADLLEFFPPWRDEAPAQPDITNPIAADTIESVLPARVEFARRARAGELALWNPYPAGGSALGSVPDYGVLSPFNLPYLLLPAWYAPGIAKLLELAAAVGFTYLFLRRVGLSRPAAILAGMVYANSGFQVVWTNWPHPQVGALIPALFWAAERLLQLRTPPAAAPLALAFAAMLLGGFPAVAGYALLALVPYALLRSATLAGRRPWPALLASAGVAAALLLGAALAAFQLQPFWERLAVTDLEYREQTPDDHLPARALVTLAAPNAYGSVVGRDYRLDWPNYIEAQSFVGATAVVLVLVALSARPPPGAAEGVRLFVAAAAGVTVALVYFGGPPLAAAQELYLFAGNFVARMRSLLGFLLAVLAGFGVERLLRGSARPGSWPGRAVALVVWPAAGALAAWGVVDALAVAEQHGQRAEALAALRVPAAVGGAAVAASAAAGLLGGPWRLLPVAALPALLTVESLAFVGPYWPRVELERFHPTTAAHAFLDEHLGADRFAPARAMLPSSNVYWRQRAVTGHVFHQRTWQDLLIAVDEDVFFGRSTYSRLRPPPEIDAGSPVLDRLAARFLVTPPDDHVIGEPVGLAGSAGRTVLRDRQPVSVELPARPLRAVRLYPAGALVPDGPFASLDVDLIDEGGRVLAHGSRRLLHGVGAAPMLVPLAAEDVDADPDGRLRARLTLRGTGGQLPVHATAAGDPLLSLVVPGEDRLRLAHVRGVLVYERLDSLPRVRWASRARVEPDPASRVATLAAGLDAETVLLHADGPPALGAPASVTVLADGGDRVRVAVDAAGDGYLVVADALQHDWVAALDGRPVPLRHADHALVAVAVPAGRHEVTLSYRPATRGPAGGVSAAAAALTVALWPLGLLAGRRRRGPPAGRGAHAAPAGRGRGRHAAPAWHARLGRRLIRGASGRG